MNNNLLNYGLSLLGLTMTKCVLVKHYESNHKAN